MYLEIISFGKIAEFIHHHHIEVFDIDTTDKLQHYLEKSFPQLSEMKYKLAINHNIVQSNQMLNNKDKVAIMPPFSGG